MKAIVQWLLKPTFGRKGFVRFYEILKNISFQGLNFRNTDIEKNGELFFLKKLNSFYSSAGVSPVLFDVGANVGNYAKHLFQTFGQNSSIYSFEPFSHPFIELELKKDTIPVLRTFKIGFSDKNQLLNIFTNKEFSEVGGLYNRDFSKFNIFLNEAEECSFVTLDGFCKENSVGQIHLLKIDVEGHELFVLKGASGMLGNGSIDFIQFEFGTGNYLSKTYMFDFFELLSPNFRIFKLLGNGFREMKEYNTDMEIHILSNYIAVRKDISPGFLKSY